jgi:hypothetical protein
VGQAVPNNAGGLAASPASACPATRRRTFEGQPSPWRVAAFLPLPGSRPRSWLSREPFECAFPVGGEGAAMLACCLPRRSGGPYCARHHAIAYRPAPQLTGPAEHDREAEIASRAA